MKMKPKFYKIKPIPLKQRVRKIYEILFQRFEKRKDIMCMQEVQ